MPQNSIFLSDYKGSHKKTTPESVVEISNFIQILDKSKGNTSCSNISSFYFLIILTTDSESLILIKYAPESKEETSVCLFSNFPVFTSCPDIL